MSKLHFTTIFAAGLIGMASFSAQAQTTSAQLSDAQLDQVCKTQPVSTGVAKKSKKKVKFGNKAASYESACDAYRKRQVAAAEASKTVKPVATVTPAPAPAPVVYKAPIITPGPAPVVQAPVITPAPTPAPVVVVAAPAAISPLVIGLGVLAAGALVANSGSSTTSHH
jgi:hypothetical protein